MSEGVLLLPRNTDKVAPLRSGPTTVGTAGVNISAKPGRVYHVTTVNKTATVYFVQIHDKATAPVAADVPIWEGKLPANGDCDLDFGVCGLYCALGFSVAISTTAGALTLAAANDAVTYAQYTSAG